MSTKGPGLEYLPAEFIITIDGPAGVGKSTAARALAQSLGFELLNTGAMYRAVTAAAIRAEIDLNDKEAVNRFAAHLALRCEGDQIHVNQVNVTPVLYQPEIAEHIQAISDNLLIRSLLGEIQKNIAHGKRIVTEGRDQGTEIFPHAACKIFLTATPLTRARRRFDELLRQEKEITLEEVLAQQELRDFNDRHRPVGALRTASDAVTVATDALDPPAVLARLVEIVHEKSGLANR